MRVLVTGIVRGDETSLADTTWYAEAVSAQFAGAGSALGSFLAAAAAAGLEARPLAGTATGFLTGAQLMLQRDVCGRPMAQPCYVNPDYRYWMLGLMEDYAKSYPVAGIMWGSERRGPFKSTVLGGEPYCFCEHCLANGRAAGIHVERARLGYRELPDFVRAHPSAFGTRW